MVEASARQDHGPSRRRLYDTAPGDRARGHAGRGHEQLAVRRGRVQHAGRFYRGRHHMGHRASQQQLLGVRRQHGRQPHDRPGTSIRQEIRPVSLRHGRQPGDRSPILLPQHVELLASRHRGARLGDGRQPRMGQLGLGTPIHGGVRMPFGRCAPIAVHRPGRRISATGTACGLPNTPT